MCRVSKKIVFFMLLKNKEMKKLYLLHILAMIALFFLGTHFLAEYMGVMGKMATEDITGSLGSELDYGIPSQNYAICSLFFFAISILVALRTIPRMRKTGGILLFGAIAYIAWSFLIISTPRSINISETFPAWIAYIVVAIVLSIIGILRIDAAPLPVVHYEDQILDKDF